MTIYNYLVALLPLVCIAVLAAVVVRFPIDSPRKGRLHPGE
jgi:hypothetical protein